MLVAILSLVIGLVVLVWSAGRFVAGASSLAKYCGLSSFLIGMLVVGFGTSAPEIAVSIFAALENTPELAIGNAYGSNIGNIALILGLTSIIYPIVVPKNALRMDLPFLIFATALSFIFLIDGNLTRIEGIFLILLFAIIIGFQIWKGFADKTEEQDQESNSNSLLYSLFWLILGLALLIGSSRLLVYGATEIAKSLGVSDLLIGLTVVAIGTSLPELASSVIAARKGDTDLALGNIVGSNIFNTLVVVGIPTIIQPMKVDSLVLNRDIPVMVGLTLLLFAFGLRFLSKEKDKPRIGRIKGIILFLGYLAYTTYLIVTA